jgi:DNA-directed RNA polymerase
MDAYDALVWLGGVVWDAIGEVVLAARDCMVWLRDISDKCIEVGVAPGWVTPSGFPVLQHYKKGKSKLVLLKIGDPLAIRLTQPVNKDDARKHRNGIAPNFIHSLDAALMVRTVNRANQLGVKDFMMIHDSFATHAANAGILADVIRDEAVSMFSEDLLENFRGQIQELVGDAFVVPPPPASGTLDITGLLQSRYFFA